MKPRKRGWTFLVVGVWVAVLGLSMVMAPATVDARIDNPDIGWMVYTPNHPLACAPLPYDCYVIWIVPDS